MSKNFEQAYKELAQNEMPDLWDRIEAGLKEKSAPVGETMQEEGTADRTTGKENTIHKSIAGQNMAQQSIEEEEQKAEERKEEKAQTPVKGGIHPAIKTLQRYFGLAAAVVCAAVVIPAVLLLGHKMGDSHMAETGVDSAAAGAMTEESMEAAVEETADESFEAAAEEAGGTDGEMSGALAEGWSMAESPVKDSMAEKAEDMEKRSDKAVSTEGKTEEAPQDMAADAARGDMGEGAGEPSKEMKQQNAEEEKEPAQGTTLNNVVIEVKDIADGKSVQEGTLYTGVVKEDPSGYLEPEQQIIVFVPVYSSIALIEGATFEVDMVYENGEGYSFVLTGYHQESER